MREKGGRTGPKAHSKNSDFGTPYDLGTLQGRSKRGRSAKRRKRAQKNSFPGARKFG